VLGECTRFRCAVGRLLPRRRWLCSLTHGQPASAALWSCWRARKPAHPEIKAAMPRCPECDAAVRLCARPSQARDHRVVGERTACRFQIEGTDGRCRVRRRRSNANLLPGQG
jgi:hypothetical protein